MAKHRTEDLDGLLLDAAVASVDPRCQGLTLGAINGVLCGYTVEDGHKCAAIVLPGPGAVAWTKARKALRGCRETEFASTYAPSSSWSDGGPLIERERIKLMPADGPGYFGGERVDGPRWLALHPQLSMNEMGPTPLVAAMRALVAAKLGPEVELPDAAT